MVRIIVDQTLVQDLLETSDRLYHQDVSDLQRQFIEAYWEAFHFEKQILIELEAE